jgi:hypothetical protein
LWKERTAANDIVVLYKPLLLCFKTEAGGKNKKDPATVFKLIAKPLFADILLKNIIIKTVRGRSILKLWKFLLLQQ